MTKTDFINRFAEETTWTKKDSEFAINTAIKVISDFLAEGEKLYECQTGRNPMDKDTVTGLIVENRQKKGLYGIKNVSQGVWRGFYPDGKIKDIPNGQGIPIWNGMSVRFELGEEWNLRLMQQVEERKEDEDEQTV